MMTHTPRHSHTRVLDLFLSRQYRVQALPSGGSQHFRTKGTEALRNEPITE